MHLKEEVNDGDSHANGVFGANEPQLHFLIVIDEDRGVFSVEGPIIAMTDPCHKRKLAGVPPGSIPLPATIRRWHGVSALEECADGDRLT